MRYVVVNDRSPEGASHCAFCPAEILDSYVRDVKTRIVYCTHWCLEAAWFAERRCHDAPAITYVGGGDVPKQAP